MRGEETPGVYCVETEKGECTRLSAIGAIIAF